MTATQYDPSTAAPSNSAVTLSGLGLTVLVAGQILTQLDFSIVNVALDRIGASLHTGAVGLVLVVACYGLTFATLLGAGGRLGDRYGRRRVFLIGVVGFCVASMLCGVATSLGLMLVGRLLQGACGALLMPQILATIHATLTGARHSRAVGVYTAVAGLSVVAGQVLGGWLVSADLWGLGWRLGFYANLPVCVLVVALGLLHVPDTKGAVARRTDVAGMTLFALLLASLLVPVTLGSSWPGVRWLALAALPLGTLLWRVESRQEASGGWPLLPPSLMRTPNLATGLAAEAAVTFSYAGFLFVTALCLQSALGFTPLASGSSFVGLGVLFFVTSVVSAPVSERLGCRRTFVVGSVLTVSGLLATAWLMVRLGERLGVGPVVAASGLVGMGNALMLTSAYRIALTRVRQEHSGEAAVAVATVQQGCFALGTALAGAVYAVLLRHGYVDAYTGAVAVVGVVPVLASVLLAVTAPRRPGRGRGSRRGGRDRPRPARP